MNKIHFNHDSNYDHFEFTPQKRKKKTITKNPNPRGDGVFKTGTWGLKPQVLSITTNPNGFELAVDCHILIKVVNP